MRRRPLGTLLLAVLPACDAQGPPPEPEVRDSAGIEIVSSDARMRSEVDEWIIDPEPALSLGGDGTGAALQFHRVARALRIGETIVVADAGSGEIRWFDSAGDFRAAAGGEGEGPGEFLDLSWIGPVPGGGVLAWDRRLRRLSLFDAGRFIRDLSPALPERATFPRVHDVLDDGTVVASPGPIYVPENQPGVQRPPMPLWLFGMDVPGLDTVGPFPGTAVSLRPAQGPGWIRTEVPFGPETLVAAGPESVVVGDNASYELRWFSRNGDLVRVARVREAQREVTRADVERELERRLERVPPNENIRAGIRASYHATPPAEVMPAFDGLMTDAAGRVWVRRGEEETDTDRSGGSAGVAWDVLNERGILVARARTPAGLRVTEIGADYVLGVWTDALGVEHVRLHRATRGPLPADGTPISNSPEALPAFSRAWVSHDVRNRRLGFTGRLALSASVRLFAASPLANPTPTAQPPPIAPNTGRPMPRTLAPVVLALTCVAALSACDLLEPEHELFEDLRHYVHAPPDCTPVPGTEQGCQARVTFCPDGTAAYLGLGGDIIEPGTYQVIGSRVRLDRTHFDRLLYFTLSGHDPTLLVDDWDREWVLATDGGFCPGSSSGEG